MVWPELAPWTVVVAELLPVVVPLRVPLVFDEFVLLDETVFDPRVVDELLVVELFDVPFVLVLVPLVELLLVVVPRLVVVVVLLFVVVLFRVPLDVLDELVVVVPPVDVLLLLVPVVVPRVVPDVPVVVLLFDELFVVVFRLVADEVLPFVDVLLLFEVVEVLLLLVPLVLPALLELTVPELLPVVPRVEPDVETVPPLPRPLVKFELVPDVPDVFVPVVPELFVDEFVVVPLDPAAPPAVLVLRLLVVEPRVVLVVELFVPVDVPAVEPFELDVDEPVPPVVPRVVDVLELFVPVLEPTLVFLDELLDAELDEFELKLELDDELFEDTVLDRVDELVEPPVDELLPVVEPLLLFVLELPELLPLDDVLVVLVLIELLDVDVLPVVRVELLLEVEFGSALGGVAPAADATLTVPLLRGRMVDWRGVVMNVRELPAPSTRSSWVVATVTITWRGSGRRLHWNQGPGAVELAAAVLTLGSAALVPMWMFRLHMPATVLMAGTGAGGPPGRMSHVPCHRSSWSAGADQS